MEKITKDMIMGDIVRNYAGASMALMNVGMGCVSCPAALSESLENARMVHGMDGQEVANYLNEQLNLA